MRTPRAGTAMERRDFLKISVAASGGLLIGFQFASISSLARASESAAKRGPNRRSPGDL